ALSVKPPFPVNKGASQLLSGESPPHLRCSTGMIERQCARIDRLAENLLAFARLESGTFQLYPTEVELGPIVGEVGRDAAKLAPDHDVEVHLLANPCIHADPERLTLVLRNAIHAALRSSQEHGAIAMNLTRSGADAQIEVSYLHSDVCERETDFDDMGAGRFVTARIVEAHGGTITEQANGALTTFQIRIPISPEGAR